MQFYIGQEVVVDRGMPTQFQGEICGTAFLHRENGEVYPCYLVHLEVPLTTPWGGVAFSIPVHPNNITEYFPDV